MGDEARSEEVKRAIVAETALWHALRRCHELEEQVTVVQKRCTELLLEKRSLDRSAHVRAFHAKYGHPIGDRPHVPKDEVVRFRLLLAAEEFFELLDSCLRPPEPGTLYDTAQVDERVMNLAKGITDRVIRLAPVRVDLPALVDALADLQYVLTGAEVVLGVAGAPVHQIVHEANMAKVPNGTGKPGKPVGWSPPDVEGELRRQGWNG